MDRHLCDSFAQSGPFEPEFELAKMAAPNCTNPKWPVGITAIEHVVVVVADIVEQGEQRSWLVCVRNEALKWTRRDATRAALIPLSQYEEHENSIRRRRQNWSSVWSSSLPLFKFKSGSGITWLKVCFHGQTDKEREGERGQFPVALLMLLYLKSRRNCFLNCSWQNKIVRQTNWRTRPLVKLDPKGRKIHRPLCKWLCVGNGFYSNSLLMPLACPSLASSIHSNCV